MRHTLPSLTLALLAVACDGSSSPTEPGRPGFTVTRGAIEETVIVESDCIGEPIELRLRQQVVVHGSSDVRGGSHFHLVINDRGTRGVGLVSGMTYRQTGAETDTDNVLGPPPLILTAHSTLNLVGQGAAPDLRIRSSFHVVVNPGGDVTVFRDETTVICH